MDPLDRFSAALAAEHDGDVATPGVTRSRILERLVKKRSPRSPLRVLWAIPLFMLGAGTALAASGRLPVVLDPVARWLESERAPASASSTPQAKAPRRGAWAPKAPALASSSAATPAPTATPISPTSTGALAVATHPAGPALVATPAAAAPATATPATSAVAPASKVPAATSPRPAAFLAPTVVTSSEPIEPPQAPAGEPGLATYAAAHHAQFRSQDCGAAVRLYEHYLESSPSGSFVADARYNRSLCLLRLGRTAEARPILTAFARGTYGDYRKFEAARLLDALSVGAP